MKTIRLYINEKKVVAYRNWLVTYGINSGRNYVIQVNLLSLIGTDMHLKIYNSKNKPIVRNLNLISIALFPLLLMILPFLVSTPALKYYYKKKKVSFGLPTHINEPVDFNLATIMLILFLIGILILK